MGRGLEVGAASGRRARVAQHEVEDPLGPDARRHLGEQLLGIAAVDAGVGVGGLRRRAVSSATKRSMAATSAFGPWPVTTPVRRSSVSHSAGMSGSGASTGGE